GVVPHLGTVSVAPITQAVVQVVAAGVAACLYATAALVPRESLAWAGLVGAGGWAVFLLLQHDNQSLIVATAVASVLIGVTGTILARHQGTHAFVYVVPGVMPLVPGLTIYQGMLGLFTGSGAAVGMLLRAVALGLTIAAGVSLGEMIIRPVQRLADPAEAANAEGEAAVSLRAPHGPANASLSSTGVVRSSSQSYGRRMSPISEGPRTLKFVHTYGAGIHSGDREPDVHNPRWQQRQIEDFVQFTLEAEELGFDGVTLTEHHAPLMTCPSPHLLLAAAAVKTTRIRLGTAVTVLPLYHPVRVAEEAGTLDLLSGGRFELGLGRGVPREALFAVGRDLSPDELERGWAESIELLHLALTERDFTFDGEFFQVTRPTTIATRPLQDPLPVWLGGRSLETMGKAAERGWSVMRNFGSNADHREALEHYVKVAAGHGYTRTGANMMIERFVAIGDTEQEAERNLDVLARSFGTFLNIYQAGGRREIPESDAEFHAAPGSPHASGANLAAQRPGLAVSGTPDQLTESLGQVIEETGARRLIVELFSSRERRQFAEEVIPALRARYESG
ncbi:MAG TPA: LLM class flavin-dependent oxidoreductase, partial [Trebonia sp.]|nr:LLM class flavin-dependent oxidoreductase [Trebonia sp.]